MKSILLIGLGRFGRHIAKKLDELFFNHHSTCYGAIVALGKNAAEPHHENDDTLLRKGD